jgi:starvation-inducible DNA-binding protein
MEELSITLKIALANTFCMYFKSHSHHWNVVGMDFSQLHDFFGDLYEELHSAVDGLAEELRAIDQPAPRTLSEMYQYKTINEGNIAITAQEMLEDLLIANNGVIDSLNKAMESATASNEQGLMDFLANRLDTHKKHGWMIRSHFK